MGLEWLLSVLIALAVVGFVVWIVLQIPMPTVFKNVILGLAGLVLVIWLLRTVVPQLAH